MTIGLAAEQKIHGRCWKAPVVPLQAQQQQPLRGLVPFAIGTETYGSIISPSTVCGATGLRPTFGSISRSGAMTLCWSLYKAGPICRSAEDAAIVFNYLHGTDGKDAAAVNMPFNYT